MADAQVRITIELYDDGRVSCQGPMSNKLLCYGMLEMARQIIQAHQQQIVTPAPPGLQVPRN